MSILNNLFGNKEIPSYTNSANIGSFLLSVAHGAIPFYIPNNQSNRRNASFEVLLFSSQHVLQLVHSKAPKKYDEIESKYHKELFSYSRINGYDRIILMELSDFIGNRFELYYHEMKGLHEIQGFIPARTIYNFYDNPLQNISALSRSNNLSKVEIIYAALNPVKKILENGVDLVIAPYLT